MKLPANSSTVTKTVADVVDALPVQTLTELDVADLADVVADVTEHAGGTALALGATSGAVATRTARVAWRNRSLLATIAIVALAVVGAVALWNARSGSSDDPAVA
jgi:hypothetical protein